MIHPTIAIYLVYLYVNICIYMQKPSKDKTTVKVEGTTEIGTSGAHVPSWELELKLGMELELGMWMGMRSWDGVWGCGAWPEFCLSWRTVSGSAFYDTHMHIHACTYICMANPNRKSRIARGNPFCGPF